jgi:hypothetical protein
MHFIRLISGTAIANAELIISLTPLDTASPELTGFVVNSKNHRNHHATDN